MHRKFNNISNHSRGYVQNTLKIFPCPHFQILKKLPQFFFVGGGGVGIRKLKYAKKYLKVTGHSKKIQGFPHQYKIFCYITFTFKRPSVQVFFYITLTFKRPSLWLLRFKIDQFVPFWLIFKVFSCKKGNLINYSSK